MPDFAYESILHARGVKRVAGVDEAGRGPLAGPVVAAAVILPLGYDGLGLDDSKKLSAVRREVLYERLTGDAEVRWAVGLADSGEIDRMNILRATHLAMRRAVEALEPQPEHCLIDGLPVLGFPIAHDAIVKGDGLSLSIAGASIIAKVSRDRIMAVLDKEFPEFGFAKHQGYGTKAHLEALRTHGPCCHHRRSFQPVAQLPLLFDGA